MGVCVIVGLFHGNYSLFTKIGPGSKLHMFAPYSPSKQSVCDSLLFIEKKMLGSSSLFRVKGLTLQFCWSRVGHSIAAVGYCVSLNGYLSIKSLRGPVDPVLKQVRLLTRTSIYLLPVIVP